MAVESVDYINDLNSAQPDGADGVDEGDNHIRELKGGLLKTFTDVSFPVSGYYTAGGTANAITATTTASITAYVAGMELFVKAGSDNTGSTTLNVNAIAAKTIKHPDGTNLRAGDIQSGQIIHVRYDGTNFQLLNPNVNILDIQNNAYSYAADSGAADAYVITITPAPSAYTTGLSVLMKATNTNTGASTINVNSLGVKSIKRLDSTNPVAADISAGGIYRLTYDSTADVFFLESTAANPTQAGTDINTKISSADTTTGYLDDKIPNMPIGNAAANEVLNIQAYIYIQSRG